jgi:hypothetical protein
LRSSRQLPLSQMKSCSQGQLALEPPTQNFGPWQLLLAHSPSLEQVCPSAFLQVPPPQVVPAAQLLRFS